MDNFRKYFEINTGLTKFTTKKASIHVADDNMHVWDTGVAWSIHLDKKNMSKFISILSYKDDKDADIKIGVTHIWREDCLEECASDNQHHIVFDAGLCRNILVINGGILAPFIDYLRIANQEQKP